MCAMLLQEYEAQRLSQQDSAAVGQQERIDDPTQRLSDTACEASGLHHQGASSRVVCCNTYHLSHVYLHTDSKQKMLSLMDLASVLF